MSDTGPVPEPSPPGGLSRALLQELHEGLAHLRHMADLLPDAPASPSGPGRGPSNPSAVAMAAALALRRRTDGKGDWLGHGPGTEGALLVMGVSPGEWVERVAAAAASPAEGRRCGVPWSCLRRGFSGTDASPGTLVEVMAGITLAFRLRGEPRVGMLLVDGASSATGAWHEGLNLAAVQRCPMVVVLLQAGTGSGMAGLPGAGTMARAYGTGLRSTDAVDLPGVTAAALESVAAARSGKGVQLLEVRLPVGPTGVERAEPDSPGGHDDE